MTEIVPLLRRPSVTALVLTIGLVSGPVDPAFACAPDAYIGSVCMTAASYCPAGFATLSSYNQLVPVDEAQALFALLGTTYGGDARTNFGLPAMGGRTPVGSGSGPGLTPYFLGQYPGRDMVTLDAAQLPAHTHTASFSTDTTGVSATAGLEASTASNGAATPTNGAYLGVLKKGRGDPGNAWTGTTPSHPIEVQGVSATVSGGFVAGQVINGDSGGGQSFYISSPRQAIRFCINVGGVWPPRPSN